MIVLRWMEVLTKFWVALYRCHSERRAIENHDEYDFEYYIDFLRVNLETADCMSTHPSTTDSVCPHQISRVLARVFRVLMLASRTRLTSTFTRACFFRDVFLPMASQRIDPSLSRLSIDTYRSYRTAEILRVRRLKSVWNRRSQRAICVNISVARDFQAWLCPSLERRVLFCRVLRFSTEWIEWTIVDKTQSIRQVESISILHRMISDQRKHSEKRFLINEEHHHLDILHQERIPTTEHPVDGSKRAGMDDDYLHPITLCWQDNLPSTSPFAFIFISKGFDECSTLWIRDEKVEFDRLFPCVEILLFVETMEVRSIFGKNRFVEQAL